MSLISSHPILIAYLAIINLVAFVYYGLDKSLARHKARRVSEKTLWLLAAGGGTLGALMGMNFFRHKTKKLSFQLGLLAILMAQLLIIKFLIAFGFQI